jgi:3-hydroxyisobutyrate dehydrogenase-like beta-hydroxyacid dehydrogenase
MKVGFIGLGHMGLPMAANLLAGGYEVVVYNRTASKADELVAGGAERAGSPAELAAACEVIMACLLTPNVCEEIFLGDSGVVEAARGDSLILDFSTNGPDTSRRIYDAAKSRGVGYLDAPISGGPTGAKSATLAIMVGGDDADFERAKPIFETLGTTIHHMGSSGCGSAAKLANQIILGGTLAVCCEAYVTATKYGIDPGQLFEVLMGSSSGGKVMERNIGTMILNNDFEAQFSLDLLTKDLALSTKLAGDLGVRMLMGSMAELMAREGQALGLGGSDMVVMIRPMEEAAKVEVRARPG